MKFWLELHCDNDVACLDGCPVMAGDYPSMLSIKPSQDLPHLIRRAEKAGWHRERIDGETKCYCPVCAKALGYTG